jgi:hypothetical protein
VLYQRALSKVLVATVAAATALLAYDRGVTRAAPLPPPMDDVEADMPLEEQLAVERVAYLKVDHPLARIVESDDQAVGRILYESEEMDQVQEVVTGRSALLELTRPLVEAFQPGVDERKTPQDRESVDLILNGTASLAILGQPLSMAERARGLFEVRIGWFAPVLAVPRGHPVHGLTDACARDLVLGRYPSWISLGGENQPVRLLGPAQGPLSRLVAERLVQAVDSDPLAIAQRYESAVVAATALDNADPRSTVALLPLPALLSGHRALVIGRRRPSLALVESGQWPWAIPVSLVCRDADRGLLDDAIALLDREGLRTRLRHHLVLEGDSVRSVMQFAPAPR